MIDDLDQDSLDLLLSLGYLPNIKARLVDNGVVFTNSMSTDSICCPSRATFLTGQYTHNHGVYDVTKGAGYLYPPQNDSTGQNGESTLLPTWLKAAGYRTALFGKYLNGYGTTDGGDPSRIPTGWDKWLGLYGMATYQVYGYTYNEDGVTRTAGTTDADYQSDFLASKAEEFLAGVSTDAPLFLYLAPTPPHTEMPEVWSTGVLSYNVVYSWEVPPPIRYEFLVDGDLANGELPEQDQSAPNFNELDVSDKPDWLRNDVPSLGQQAKTWAARQYKQRLASTIAIDDFVGRVVNSLDSRGMLDDTLLVFTSDNGFLLGEHRLVEKGVPYEEAIRVPLVIGGAGTQAGSQCAALVGNHDLAVTIADFAGATPTRETDGRSLRPWLTNASTASSRNQLLIEHYQEQTLVRAFDIIWPYGGLRILGAKPGLFVDYGPVPGATVTKEYYDLATDPDQLDNAYSSLGTLTGNALTDRLSNLSACVGLECRQAEDAF
jgi:arylsulfatase A-like enzyme